MGIIPLIFFKGNCREAIDFYKESLGAVIDNITTYGDVRAGSEEQKNLIMNCEIDMGGAKFHLADHNPNMVTAGNQISFTIILDNPDEVREIFTKLKEGAEVAIEPMETFFSLCHSALTDKFGIVWQINCPKR